MSMISYGDPTVTVWEIDDNGNKISVPVNNIDYQVIGNKIVLDGLPDEQYRVHIDGYVEINIRDKIIEVNQFKVDYRKSGVVFVHPSLNGTWITVTSYYSKGVIKYPSNRIWTTVNINGEVTETLDEALDVLNNRSSEGENNIAALEGVRIYQGAAEPTDTSFWYDPSDE